MILESWMYGDPAKVLERKGEGCDHCTHLKQWDVFGRYTLLCDKGYDIGKRCGAWKHEKGASND